MDKCENCSRSIGKLETPFVFNEHVVCQACHRVLQNRAEQVHPSQEDPVLFCQEGITVTKTKILNSEGYVSTSEILSFDSATNWNLRTLVRLYDLLKRPHKFTFESNRIAVDFIAAVRMANPSISPAASDGGWFFFVEW